MKHLSPEELLDVAEGSRAGREFPHLQSCDSCARQLADLRAVMGTVADASIPEPSPLFWRHLSARVREAIAECAVADRPGWIAGGWWRIAAAAAAVIVLAVVLGPALRRAPAPSAPPLNGSANPTEAQPAALADPPRSDMSAFDDDPALTLLADLTSEMDWDTAAEAGLAPAEGAVDSVVFALSAEERVELHRLLQEALAGSGA